MEDFHHRASILRCGSLQSYDAGVAPQRRQLTRYYSPQKLTCWFYIQSEKTVKQFLQETSDRWLPLFVDILSQPLAPIPSEEEELRNGPEVLAWRGVIALRLQVIKVNLIELIPA